MEEFKKILIPTDGSEYTREAIQKGLSLAKLIGAKVTAIYVMDQSAFAAIPPDSLMNDLHGLLQNEGEEAVAHVKEMGDEMGVEVATKILEGSPAHA
ncbi:MAG: universal stress protein, partial [Thermoplasmata archaeon]|nr:universal stress protein [Thermoplasmata archaeon]